MHKDFGLKKGVKLCPPPSTPSPSLAAFTPSFESEKCFGRGGTPLRPPRHRAAAEASGGLSPYQSALPQLSAPWGGSAPQIVALTWGRSPQPPHLIFLIYKILYPSPQRPPRPQRSLYLGDLLAPPFNFISLQQSQILKAINLCLHCGGVTRGPGGDQVPGFWGSALFPTAPCRAGGRYGMGSPHGALGGSRLQLGPNPCTEC